MNLIRVMPAKGQDAFHAIAALPLLARPAVAAGARPY